MDKKLPAEEVTNLLQEVDMNDSGAIDYEEFLAATLHASKIATDEHLKRAFQEFDADNSGVDSEWNRILPETKIRFTQFTHDRYYYTRRIKEGSTKMRWVPR